MSDIGPTWLRKELPQPIANAWHLALEGIPVDGNAAVAAVEVALRFVTALQAASLLSTGGQLPELLTNPARIRKNWTFGSWVLLLRELRDALDAPFIPELGAWPDEPTESLLWQFKDVRDDKLSHAGQKTPYVRREVEQKLADQAAAVLATLEWLRKVELVYFIEAHVESDGRFRGRAQVFRSWDDQPASARFEWEGPIALHHLYLASTEAAASHLLDVEPFVRRTRLREAHTEAICLWSGVGKRGDVKLTDDIQEQSDWVPMPARLPLVPFTLLSARRPPTDAALEAVGDAVASGSAASEPAPAAPVAVRRRSSGRRHGLWLWLGLGALLGVGGLAVALALPPSNACGAPALTGTWRFDTEVRHTKAGRESARGVRGHYSVTFEPTAADCTVPATIIKTGFTEAGRASQGQLSDRVTFAPSPTGWSAAANAHIAGGSGVVDIAFRVAREGDALVGLWRYEGESWQRAGFAGGLVGDAHTGRGTASGEVGFVDARFHDCVERCRDAEAPLAVESEDCLRRCAPRLDDCPG